MTDSVLMKFAGVFVLMGIVIGITFGQSLRHEFVTWDDTILITENPIVQTPSIKSVAKAFSSYDPELYIPLTFVSYQLNSLVCGMNPTCFHATDLILHTLNAVLVFAVLSLFLESDLIALLFALLFAVHPLNTESAVWASARKDTLSTLFFLSAITLYVHDIRKSTSRKHRFLSYVLYLCGLLSKVSVITLPIIFLLIDVHTGRRDFRKMIREKIPYVVLAVVFGVIAIIGKTSVLASTTPLETFAMASRSTVYYLSAFFFPVHLSVMVPYAGNISILHPEFLFSLLTVLVLIATAVLLRKKFHVLLFSLFFFLITLTPSFTNFSKGGDVYIASDRYAYIPMIGLLYLLSVVLLHFLSNSHTERIYRSRKKAIIAGGVALITFFIYLSRNQTETWANSESLYEYTVSLYPTARAGVTNLGMEKLKKGEFEKALTLFNESLSIKDDVSVRANRASALYLAGDTKNAKIEYESILKENPALAEAHYNLGNIARREGRTKEAIQYYKDALAIDHTYFNALNNLAGLYAETGDLENAGNTYGFLSDAYPDSAESAFNAGVAFEHLKYFSTSQKYYERAMRANPTDATTLASLATVLYEQGQIDPSARTLMQAIDLDPNNATAITLALRMKKDGYAK